MEWLLNIIYYVVPFLILLGILVFVHEFGHFIVARKLGVAVSAFSIGFGKKLWSVMDKKGTEWKISAIPLGGYCQFLGDADESSSTAEVDLSKYTEEEQKHLFATQKPVKKLAIAVAGPLFNYLFAFIISSAFRQREEILPQSSAAITSFGKSLEPIPTQKTPALNQAERFSSVGSTAPVTIICAQGSGAFTFLTKDGPPTFPAGKTFTRSQPASWALPISVTEPHPGV